MEQAAEQITDLSNLNHPFLESLIDEAMNHRAVNHPYLTALANGSFANMPAVLRDFAGQYGFYSSWFPRYLTGVISKMEHVEHRTHLLDNLAEESGHLHEEDLDAIRALGIKDEWVQGIPHPQLFKRFQHAIGAETSGKPGIEVEIWRDGFLSLIQNKSAANAVGAIGLGTESVVKHIYHPIIKAIEKYIIDDITGPTGIINIVRQQVFNISSFGTGMKAGMKAGMQIKQNYLQYILKYGVPADGIFDPELLAEF